MFGVILAAIAYILSSCVMMGIIPNSELAASSSPFALVAVSILGPVGGWLVSVCAILACFRTLAG